MDIRGDQWEVRFVPRTELRKGEWGHCDRHHRIIRVLQTLGRRNKLRILIHEVIHACCWDLSEETVIEFDDALTRAIFHAGFLE
jgi:hypothetical protein